MRGEAQGAAQLGLADQEERAEGLAVHVGGEKQAQLLEGGVRQELSLIEDEQRGAVFVEQLVFQDRADARDHFGSGEGRLVAEGNQEIAVEAGDAQEGIGEVDDKIAVGIQRGGEAAHGGGFAAAGLSGEQAQATLLCKGSSGNCSTNSKLPF